MSHFDASVGPGPIIICGCHGGGTSYIAKLLRWRGLFVGGDAGSRNDRKFHESRLMRHLNCWALRTVDKNVLTPQQVAAAREYLRAHEEEILARWHKALAKPQKNFWRGCSPGQIWGWKDPRNSLTARLWLRLFPEGCVLVVRKKHVAGQSKSPSGEWFRRKSKEAVRFAYMRPELPEGADTLAVSFEQVTTSVAACNEMLQWCGLETVDKAGFKKLLKDTRFESRSK